MTDPVRVGVVGLGYWGPNLARNFDRLPGTELRWICDASADGGTFPLQLDGDYIGDFEDVEFSVRPAGLSVVS